MQLTSIALDHLSISPVNMRHANRPPDISDILPSVKARGVLVPLLVRPNGKPDHFEIVAGRRRYYAATQALADLNAGPEQSQCGTALDSSWYSTVCWLQDQRWESLINLDSGAFRIANILRGQDPETAKLKDT
jgi:ParB-like nuclease domain